MTAEELNNIAKEHYQHDRYPKANAAATEALTLARAAGDNKEEAMALHTLGIVANYTGAYPAAEAYFRQALALYEALGNKSGAARVTGNIGIVYKNLSDYPRALEYLGKALAAHEALGEKNGAAIVTFNIGNVYNNLSDYSRALEYFGKTLSAFEELGNRRSATLAIGNIGAVYAKQDFDGYDATKAEEYLLKAVAISSEIGTKLEQYEFHKSLVDLYKQQQRWEECQSHFEKYHGLKEEVQSEEARKKAELMEQRRQADEREKQLAVERARAQATEELLHNTLPPEIADRLLAGERIADAHANVSVLFADIVDFTRLSQTLTAKELVEGLDFLFTKFDDLVEKHGLEKIKTIGDCYMAIAGAPAVRADHAEAIAAMALEMMAVAATFRAISTGEPIRLRIGLHSGEVVAGVIGRRKYTYDLWGDAVNTAARMESHGEAGKIHCSGEFVRAVGAVDDLPLHLRFVERGEMDIKGKGTMTTYFLERA